jgi:DeoR/GlpR family transcriptional regulator of sugar metabolism
MVPAQRRQHILQDILLHGGAAVTDLSRKYQVSEMTVRRDLEELEKQGHIVRTHGGAIGRRAPAIEPQYAVKQNVRASEKARIAQYAAKEFVIDGDIIVLEGGTTVTMMARRLVKRQQLTVVTNGLYTLNELVHLLPHAGVISTGGLLRDTSLTFVGPPVEEFFRAFHANKIFLSATGLTLNAGLTDPNMLEAQAKRAMIASVDQIIVLLDSSKFGVTSLTTVLPVERIAVLITDEGAPPDVLQALRERGVDVRVLTEAIS